ncbi:hypothetical protein BDB00DRAFT_828681 [Zychaea mexicana]|uniref:uncharacterized protein n=1 Tax=Zychaea mexicana TaxID=64656 RepID=UPI0022FE356D|nr:uncharacterized protein BDB00DRAFT_828681 [Zychaea mexicana]KAI9492358.1 hypothetical protein BDB00DRAFT_828681 [Zychaea mexicana]
MAIEWNEKAPSTHRLIMIELKTHFNYVFAFPRASVKSGFERELFIPYDRVFKGNDQIGKVVNARVVAVHEHHVELDRDVPEFGRRIDFEYLIYAAGTKIPQPGRLDCITKQEGIALLKKYQAVIKESKRPIIIGAGAVGLEMAAEIKEQYPDKHVTLMHSRTRYMPKYKTSVDVMTYNILKKHGVKQVLGDRVVLPKNGFPLEVKPVEVHTQGGKVIEGDLAIMCIGMKPNTELLAQLSPEAINKKTGFVNVKKTMQIDDDRFPHIFAAGDVVEHTDVKTGHFAWMQGLAILTNLLKLIDGASYDDLEPYKSKDVALIKLILGEREAVLQTNAFGPLIALGSWIAGRSTPHNVYAEFGWNLLGTPYEEKNLDL